MSPTPFTFTRPPPFRFVDVEATNAPCLCGIYAPTRAASAPVFHLAGMLYLLGRRGFGARWATFCTGHR